MKNTVAKYFFGIICFCLSQAALAVDCPPQQCTQWTEVNLCFMGAEPYWSEQSKQLAYQRTCGWDAISYQTRSPNELKGAISDLAKRCVRINKLTIASHGSPGSLALFKAPAPSITVKNLQEELGQLACWTKPGTEIVASGCNVGSGCEGDNFLSHAAQVLTPKGGKVRGPTALSGTFMPGIIPVLSSDGNKAQCTFDPLAKPPLTFQNRGEIFGTEEQRTVSNQQCVQSLRTAVSTLGNSANTSAMCNSQDRYQNTRRMIDQLVAQYGNMPSDRFLSSGANALAVTQQLVTGGIYNGTICGADGAPASRSPLLPSNTGTTGTVR